MRKTSVIRSLLASVALLAGSASVAAAAEQPILVWRGQVDREVHIIMRGRDVSTRFVGRGEDGRARAQATGRLPQRDGYVTVDVRDGRGRVDVIQQPSARNGYTTIIRIRDDYAGADRYRIAAYWEDQSRGGWGRGGSGRGGVWGNVGRGDDDDDDRDGRGGRDGGYGNGGYGNGGYGNGGWENGGQGNGGYSSGRVHWTGSVDDIAELRIQGRRVEALTVSGAPVRDARYDVSGYGLPQRDVALSIRQNGGRGAVQVIQQPSARNGYTAIVRIRDFQGGAGWYDLDLSW